MGLRFGYARQMKKGLRSCNPFIYLARPAGFEPTTPWFVAKCSIRAELRARRGRIIAKKENAWHSYCL